MASQVDAATYAYAAFRGLGEPQPPAPKGGKKKKGGRERQQAVREVIVIEDGDESSRFGDRQRIQSRRKNTKEWSSVKSLDAKSNGKKVWIRGSIHTTRKAGNKMAFILLRQQIYSIQALIVANEKPTPENPIEIPRTMIKYADKIPPESIVDIYGTVSCPDQPVKSATQHDVEIHVEKILVVSASLPELPFQIDDAARRGADVDDESGDVVVSADVDEKKGEEFVKVGRKMRLDYRYLDARTPAKHAIFRVQSAVCKYFREFFDRMNFVEVHTPKIIAGASEGGAEVFKLKYFGTPACLAQSPQLYKQMAVMSGLGGVYEVGPVFRAENSKSPRHLCEFTGLDFEMPIYEHYAEVLHVLSELFKYIFKNLNEHHRSELEAVKVQYPFDDLVYTRPGTDGEVLVLTFPEAISMLKEKAAEFEKAGKTAKEIEELGAACNDFKDFSTPNEKLLGKLVKAKYGVDFYIVDRYPLAARPFYTMPAPDDPNYTNSYDVFLRGEEITSGAQRVHDPELLTKRAQECDIPLSGLQDYINSFKYGAMPHGGAGIGMERVVMLFLDVKDVRNCSLFPRDPRRLKP